LIFKEKAIVAKPGIHPTWYPEAKVYCNGEVVMTVGSTVPELHVDVWSGNHPFFTGTQKIIDTEGRVERFLRKYGMLEGGEETPVETGSAAPKRTTGTKKKK
jgi:large subunit ribosomal protein L31